MLGRRLNVTVSDIKEITAIEIFGNASLREGKGQLNMAPRKQPKKARIKLAAAVIISGLAIRE